VRAILARSAITDLPSFDPRRQGKQTADLPAVQGEIVDALGVLVVADLRAFSRDGRRGAGDLDLRLDVSDLQDRIDSHPLAGLNFQISNPFIESGRLDRERVGADDYAAEIVDAG